MNSKCERRQRVNTTESERDNYVLFIYAIFMGYVAHNAIDFPLLLMLSPNTNTHTHTHYSRARLTPKCFDLTTTVTTTTIIVTLNCGTQTIINNRKSKHTQSSDNKTHTHTIYC